MVPDVDVELICTVWDEVEAVPEQPEPLQVVTASATVT